jgi:hypothetical protein
MCANPGFDPLCRLDLEFALIGLVSGLRGLSALMGAARSIDCGPVEIAALLDLHTQKAEEVQRLAGF